MKAIWSFWTRPDQYRRLAWPSERQHLLSLLLSLETVRRHYPRTTLYTDTPGAKLLADVIGFEFDNISPSLDAIEECNPSWWSLAKLHACRLQGEPFIHFDNDVFLWRRFPERIESAQVLAQNPEDFTLGTSYYRPEKFDRALSACGGWAPEEWEWYASIGGARRRAACCGVFGGNNLEFIRHYANTAFALAENPRNQPGWARLNKESSDNLLFEQYLLSACVNYHQGRAGSPFRDIDIQYLFSRQDEAFSSHAAAALGYTHLIGAKRNHHVAERLQRRVEREYPECYERIVQHTAPA